MKLDPIPEWYAKLSFEERAAFWSRLEGVTGPERHLVGESRSDGPASDVEEAKPGRRGVGEIVELSKLLRLIYRMKEEARADKRRAQESSNPEHMSYFGGKYTALCKLRSEVLRIAEERSDLPNAASLPPGGAEVSETNVEGAKAL